MRGRGVREKLQRAKGMRRFLLLYIFGPLIANAHQQIRVLLITCVAVGHNLPSSVPVCSGEETSKASNTCCEEREQSFPRVIVLPVTQVPKEQSYVRSSSL